MFYVNNSHQNLFKCQGYLSLLGLASVGMSIGFSYGFCSLIGLAYGPLHNMIPFLLLGIGDINSLTSLICLRNIKMQMFYNV